VQLAGHAQASNNSQQLPTRSPARAGAVSSFGGGPRWPWPWLARASIEELKCMLLLALIVAVIVGIVEVIAECERRRKEKQCAQKTFALRLPLCLSL
jgi:hypothetical protein